MFWTHLATALSTLLFAALSPYIYIFRSKKVQKSLISLLWRPFVCCLGRGFSNRSFRKSRSASPLIKGKPRDRRCQSVCHFAFSAAALSKSGHTSSVENLHTQQSSNESLVSSTAKRWRSLPDLTESSSTSSSDSSGIQFAKLAKSTGKADLLLAKYHVWVLTQIHFDRFFANSFFKKITIRITHRNCIRVHT